MSSRLVLAQPVQDNVGAWFPYVDVRPNFVGTFGKTKAGAQLTGGFIVSPFTALLELSFYRLSSGNRILLANDFTPQRRIFEVRERIKDPGVGSDRDKILNFWDYLYIGTTNLAATYGVNPDHLLYQIGAENLFEELDIDSPFNFAPMIECLAVLLELEGGPDFTGLSVVEVAS